MSLRISLLLFLCFLPQCLGGLAADDDAAQHKLLCKVLKVAETVLAKYSDSIPQSKALGLIKNAINGTSNRALVDGNGVIALKPYCGGVPNGRGNLCNYYKGDVRIGGCFADSILGTLLCICTPGGHRSGNSNLCGVDSKRYGDTWSGGFTEQLDKKPLFKDVLKTIKEGCDEETQNMRDSEDFLENLKRAANSVKHVLTEGKISGKRTFYFGEKDDSRSCDGINGRNVCAAYQGESREDVHIPWMTKINQAVDELRSVLPVIPKASKDSDEAPLKKETESLPLIPGESKETAPHVEVPPRENNETSGEKEHEVGITPDTVNIQEAPKFRTKRSTQKSPSTNVPHLATDPDEDGSHITKSQWLIMAALLN